MIEFWKSTATFFSKYFLPSTFFVKSSWDIPAPAIPHVSTWNPSKMSFIYLFIQLKNTNQQTYRRLI